MVGTEPAYLGVAQDHKTEVFIAKFVGDHSGRWHGYPADHQRNQHDIPAEQVRERWLAEELLPAPKLRKIGKGQPCKL